MKALLLTLALTLPLTAQQPPQQKLALVDPFIGTGPDGHTFPGATTPFGMVQLSPDTQINDFKHSYKWASGYRYEDTTLLGFSHTHFSGSGHSDLGDILIAPSTGDFLTDPQPQPFSHQHESAAPGFYSVTLNPATPNRRIDVKLTTTPHVGLHRYTFPQGRTRNILVDLRSSIYNYPGKVLWSRLRILGTGTGAAVLTGMRETRGWAPGRQLYFAIRFSQPFLSTSLLDKEPPPEYKGFKSPGPTSQTTASLEGRGLVGAFSFAPSDEPLVVEVALSPTSEDAAIANLDAEVTQPNAGKTFSQTFDAVHQQATAAWQQQFAALDLRADRATEKNLYTALYHALISPNLEQDVAGTYRGPDNQVHTAGPGWQFVSNLSLWDTFRAEQPLMTLLQPPQRTADLVNSMLASWHESPFGILPIWQEQGLETWCMIGYHAVPEIADAVMKDIPGFDRADALKAVVASATYGPYGNLYEYMARGYIPVDTPGGGDDEAASRNVEYAFDDWTIARMATALGNQQVAATFLQRGGNWGKSFNPADGFIEPRLADGAFRKPFSPAKAGAGSGFTEGNSWQYSWFTPQDTAGLITLLGGDDKLIAKLDQMFDQKVDPNQYADVEDISGMIGQYIHGNEPSHHLAYLYVYANAPDRTQARLQQIVDSQYRPAPDGLVGNDDLGQMSAWLLFTSFGFYPVAPGSNQYVIGRPFVSEATLHLPNGKQFHILADHLSPTNAFIQSLTLNGQPLPRAFLTHEEIMHGGELRFTMSPRPQATWSHTRHELPYSLSTSR